MIEHLKQPENNPPLFDRQRVLEDQSEATLLKWREQALAEMSELEKLVHEINDVMDGAGFEGHLIRGEN